MLPAMEHNARFGWCAAAALLLAAGCDFSPPRGTGGTDVPSGPFGRGIVAVSTDYQSTNVSLVGLDGRPLSPSFISSSSFLSADVFPPTAACTGGDVVLLDRSVGLVTWVDVHTADVRAHFHADDDQIARNPWDYLPVSADKAYVTRYDPVPGKAAHGDVIVVNPITADVTSHIDKRIDIGPALKLDPGLDLVVHPARGVVIGDRAYITTVIATKEYHYANSVIVALDTRTDEIVATQELPGLHDCNGIAASPSGDDIAVTCSGDLEANDDPAPGAAGVVLLHPDTLKEDRRFPAIEIGKGVPGFFLSFATDHLLVIEMVGNVKNGIDDTALLFDLETDKVRELHRAPAVQIGSVLCPSRVEGDVKDGAPAPACFVTDADKGTLLRFPILNGTLGSPTSIVVNDREKYRPPRYLGQF
jgi:hypothetical protein